MANAMTWGETPTSDDKLWAMVAHLSVFVVPFLGALALYLVFKDTGRYVKYHAVQSLILQLVGWIIGGVTCGFGTVTLVLALWLAYRAYNGEWAGYPLIESVGKD